MEQFIALKTPNYFHCIE